MPFPFPGDLPDPGIEPMSLALAGEFFTTEPPGKPLKNRSLSKYYHSVKNDFYTHPAGAEPGGEPGRGRQRGGDGRLRGAAAGGCGGTCQQRAGGGRTPGGPRGGVTLGPPTGQELGWRGQQGQQRLGERGGER